MIVIINGPNLNLLGERNKSIYGNIDFDYYFNKVITKEFNKLNIIYKQSNHEGEIIDLLHRFGNDKKCEGIVLNAGAYTHTSLAISDAIEAVKNSVIEVHISNIFAREEIRKQTLIAKHCIGTISGFGLPSYLLAIQLLSKIKEWS